MVTTDRSGLQWSWLGFLLITTHVGLSTQRFIGFNCRDVCDSLLSDGSLNSSYFFTLSNVSNSTTSELNFCNTENSFFRSENGTVPDAVPMNVSVNVDMVDTPCARVYEEDYLGVKLQIVNTSRLNAPAPSINASSCMRACAVCNVNLPYASSCERDDACENVTRGDATTCTRTELGVFQSENELRTKLRSINDSYKKYERVLERVMPGVLIMDGDKPMCLVSVRTLTTVDRSCWCAWTWYMCSLN